MNISKINSVPSPKIPSLEMVKEDFNILKALKSIKPEKGDIATFSNAGKKVEVPEPPKMDFVKEDFNPIKFLKEIFK